MDKAVQCSVCLVSPWNDPVELEGCGHIFCRTCVQPLATCPVCREEIKATKAPNRTLLELANNLGARASIATTGPPMCPSHPCLPVDKFCRKCVREGCGICMMGTCHATHPSEIVDITTPAFVSENQKVITGKLKVVNGECKRLEEEISSLDREIRVLDQKKSTTANQLQQLKQLPSQCPTTGHEIVTVLKSLQQAGIKAPWKFSKTHSSPEVTLSDDEQSACNTSDHHYVLSNEAFETNTWKVRIVSLHNNYWIMIGIIQTLPTNHPSCGAVSNYAFASRNLVYVNGEKKPSESTPPLPADVFQAGDYVTIILEASTLRMVVDRDGADKKHYRMNVPIPEGKYYFHVDLYGAGDKVEIAA